MALKVKFRTVFPAVVQAESPILLAKEGVSYTFSIDITAMQATFDNLYQPADQTLTGLSGLNSTAGLLVQTAAETFTKRTLAGTVNEITVANGDGAAGAPTLSLPASMTLTGKTLTGGTFTGGLWNKVTITAPATAATLTLIDGTTLTGPASSGTVMTLGNTETVTGVKTFGSAGAVGRLRVAGTTSGTTILDATAVASGTLTLPAATDTLVGKATTDTFTNKTFNSTAAGNVLQVGGVTVFVGQYPGETSTGSATAGNIGEYIESVIAAGSATSLTTGTAKTITSISLTAGDWDVDCLLGTTTAASTSVTQIGASISLATNTMDFTLGRTTQWFFPATVPGAATNAWMVPVQPVRLSLSSTTTVFMVGLGVFTVSTLTGYGLIRARRAR